MMQRGFAHIHRLILVFSVCVLLNIDSVAQYYSTGQEPASIRWKQIKTEHVKLIFPDYYEARARKLVSFLDSTYAYSGTSLDYSPKRIPVIMHTQSAKSNAVVAWAPKRMEFYTMPPQDMYAQPWLEQLSIHEYRHVVQIEKLNQGPTKVLSWLFGQQGTGAVLGLYVPLWFMEGMASYFAEDETARDKMYLRDAVVNDRLPPVTADFSGFFAYRFGHAIFSYIEEKYGKEGVRDFMIETRNTLGGRVGRSVGKAFGIDAEEFEERDAANRTLAASMRPSRRHNSARRARQCGR